MTESGADLLVVVGEASGDEHTAALFRELKKLDPEVGAFGLPGDQLIAEGVQPLGHASSISVVGLVEALKVIGTARRLFRRLLREVDRRGTRVAVLVDAPGFNLRLAKALDRRGVRVLYYISPQLWAWREGRVETIRRHVDKVLVLFEFEQEWYRRRGIEAVHVGHPLVDSVPQIPGAWDRDPSLKSPAITLMPGSRRDEVERILPEMVGAAQVIAKSLPGCRFRLIRAANVDPEGLRQVFDARGIEIEVVSSDRYATIADSHLVLCASGTATLEVGLLRAPMVVVYKLQGLTHHLARRVVKIEHFSLVNLVLRDGVVPELLQQRARAVEVGRVALELLNDRSRLMDMRRRLGDLRSALGESGASARAAQEVHKAMTREAIDS